MAVARVVPSRLEVHGGIAREASGGSEEIPVRRKGFNREQRAYRVPSRTTSRGDDADPWSMRGLFTRLAGTARRSLHRWHTQGREAGALHGARRS
jgi:hypothetical protein